MAIAPAPTQLHRTVLAYASPWWRMSFSKAFQRALRDHARSAIFDGLSLEGRIRVQIDAGPTPAAEYRFLVVTSTARPIVPPMAVKSARC